MKKFWLKKELLQSRIKPSEVDELMAVADQLGRIEQPKLSRAARQRIEAATHRPSKAPRIAAWSAAGAFATITLVVISAQFAPENSPLYAIKRGTDDIRAFFAPQAKTAPTNSKKELENIDLQSSKQIESAPKSIKSPEPEKSNDNSNNNTHGTQGSKKDSGKSSDQDTSHHTKKSHRSWWWDSRDSRH